MRPDLKTTRRLRFMEKEQTQIRSPNQATRLYRTQIEHWFVSKPNFAGHFILATLGCGTDCIQLAIIDAKTGVVFFPRGITSNVAVNVQEDLLRNSGSIWHKVDSKLLVLVGAPEEDENRRGISYYVWEHDHLKLVRSVKKL